MLDRLQIAAQLADKGAALFPEHTSTLTELVQAWYQLCADSTFHYRVIQRASSCLVPDWEGSLEGQSMIEVRTNELYTVIGVDGSQIYPDRHMGGVQCAVVNIGGVVLAYGERSSALFVSEPAVLLGEDVARIHEYLSFSREGIDVYREGRELELAASWGKTHNAGTVLHDGTLIFWFLEALSPEAKSAVIEWYCAGLEALRTAQLPSAGYISYPKSRDLINLLKIWLCPTGEGVCARKRLSEGMGAGASRGSLVVRDLSVLSREGESSAAVLEKSGAVSEACPCSMTDGVIDAHLMREVLAVGERSPFFRSTSTVTESYALHLRPWFCYVRGIKEVFRLEIPEWVMRDEALCAQVCRHAYDQQLKGDGYPVVLAEAHEKAVIKEADRQFFYHLVGRIGMEHNKSFSESQKSIRKRIVGV